MQRLVSAIAAIDRGRLDQAEAILLGITANTPARYPIIDRTEHQFVIKFWDQAAFQHYVEWHNENAPLDLPVIWEANVYPRAYYYLGYIYVHRKQGESALEYLDRGLAMEPNSPLLQFEKAQALVLLKRMDDALELYQQITGVGPLVDKNLYAVCLRGQGGVLIDMGRLDEAEAKYRESLYYAPDSTIAQNELLYIQELRGGATPVVGDAIASDGISKICAMCSSKFSEGVEIEYKGIFLSICQRCDRARNKKWWQFWK